MTTSNPAVAKSGDEAQIRKLVEEWREAIRVRDLDRLEKLYAKEVVYFDVTPPYQQRGPAAYRQAWAAVFQHLPPRVTPNSREMEITVSGDLAAMHGLTRLVNDDTKKDAALGWVRVTVVYARIAGEWKVIHEHVSIPIDGMSGKMAPIREL